MRMYSYQVSSGRRLAYVSKRIRGNGLVSLSVGFDDGIIDD